MYAEASSEIKKTMSVDNTEVLFTSKYAPMMVLQLSLSEIEKWLEMKKYWRLTSGKSWRVKKRGDKTKAATYYCFAIENLIDAGATIVNSSFGFTTGNSSNYSDVERWVDYVASVHNITFVQSAGNDAKDEERTRIVSPGLSDNVLTVGAYNN